MIFPSLMKGQHFCTLLQKVLLCLPTCLLASQVQQQANKAFPLAYECMSTTIRLEPVPGRHLHELVRYTKRHTDVFNALETPRKRFKVHLLKDGQEVAVLPDERVIFLSSRVTFVLDAFATRCGFVTVLNGSWNNIFMLVSLILLFL